MKYYAHSGSSPDKSDWQTYEEHSSNVAAMAEAYARAFGAAELGYLAGLHHDDGKLTRAFQRRLEGRAERVDHSTAGGSVIRRLIPRDTGIEGSLLAPLILGHHGGVPNDRRSGRLTSVQERLTRYEEEHEEIEEELVDNTVPEDLRSCLQQLFVKSKIDGTPSLDFTCFNLFLMARLVFSALVDADWLDTERVMSPDEFAVRMAAQSQEESLTQLNDRLDAYLQELMDGSGDTPVNRARADMLAEARKAASLPTGIFTLEMPTGSGKTLASTSFALRHAIEHEKRRVIYAIPFMSIVDQTADNLRNIMGRESVIEHVSSYDYGFRSDASEDASENVLARQERMLVQNWDAPLVVTTNVQLFESLFSNRTSRSRKVHNIANSVIILDEVQSLPDALLRPTLAMLESLVAIANVTVVLCTATQPSFETVWPFGTRVHPIIEDQEKYGDTFKQRARVDVSHVGESSACSLEWLVDELSSESQALCVVSSRKAARQVFDALSDRLGDKEHVYHLSALMVPEHRSLVIQKIRGLLREGEAVHVVSTQLVEAGVDIDFPVVFRETAGIDSILQAAGRCNREGKMREKGSVVVFDCSDFSRPKKANWLSRVRQLGLITLDFARREGIDPLGPRSVQHYFEQRYRTGDLDGRKTFKKICPQDKNELKKRIAGHFDYECIADSFRFIDDDTVEIFVPWGSEGQRVLDQVCQEGLNPNAFSRIQRFSVSVPRYLYNEYEDAGSIRRINGFPVGVLETSIAAEQLYDDKRGLLSVGKGEIDPLIV